MVRAAGTFGRSGPHDFILLRASAIILGLYAIFLMSFLIATDEITYAVWTNFFAGLGVKLFTMLALTAVVIHGWIGTWQVLTDYVKIAGLRAFLQFVFSVSLIIVWLAGLLVVWPVEGV